MVVVIIHFVGFIEESKHVIIAIQHFTIIPGKKVASLEYEAYTAMAEKQLMDVCRSIREKWVVCKIAILHRTGYDWAAGYSEVNISVSISHVAWYLLGRPVSWWLFLQRTGKKPLKLYHMALMLSKVWQLFGKRFVFVKWYRELLCCWNRRCMKMVMVFGKRTRNASGLQSHRTICQHYDLHECNLK